MTDLSRVAGHAIVEVEPLTAWRMRARKRWEKLVLVQCWIRRNQHLWSALGNSLMTQRPCLRRRLYETEQVRDVDTRARSSASVLAPQRVDQAIGSRSFCETERGRDGYARASSSGVGYGPQRVVQAIGARHLSETERGRDGDTRTRRSGVGHGPQMVVQAIGALPRVRERIPAWESSPAWQ
mgnify:CR=1 FL=1